MNTIDTLIIGAGQAGLAVSRCLTGLGVEHAILERGRVAQRWRDRWESLRLLSPNWMSRLPNWSYTGPDPDGYMSRDEIVNYLTDYAKSFDAPTHENTSVLYVDRWADDWRVLTDRGAWLARNVVIATGHCAAPNVPSMAGRLPGDLVQIATIDYRSPAQFPEKGVLVVGASASGIQLADEIHRSGRDVVLAVGEHNRLPRSYRGEDILYWLDRIGSLSRPISEMPDPDEARTEPSLQIAGRDDAASIDLAALAAKGVRLAGRLAAINGTALRFADDLAETTSRAEARMRKTLERIDHYIVSRRLHRVLPEATPIAQVPLEGAPLDLDIRSAGIGGVLWATGYKRAYPWLNAPVFDERGEIRQVRGRTPSAGLWVIGLQFMIRRNSSFIDGVGRDAAEIAGNIARADREPARAKEAA